MWTLEERRNRADLLEVFKMYKGWSTTSFDSLFTLTDDSRTRGHSAKIAKSRCRLYMRRYFFSQHVIGVTENTGVENAAPSKMQRWKNAGVEKAAPDDMDGKHGQ